MIQFLGNIEAKADAKGRVFIPATFRKQLQAASEERLVLRKDVYQDCLVSLCGCRQMRVKRNYKYTGVDGMATEGGGLELVRDGIFEASYLYPTKGDEVIALAMKILKHQPYERDNYLSTSIITQANAALTLMEARDAERQTHNLKTLHKQVNQYSV